MVPGWVLMVPAGIVSITATPPAGTLLNVYWPAEFVVTGVKLDCVAYEKTPIVIPGTPSSPTFCTPLPFASLYTVPVLVPAEAPLFGLVNVLAPAPIVTADSEISLPCTMSFAPVVIAAAPLNMVPENWVFAPSDAPPTGAHNTLLAVAPFVSETVEPDTEVSAPLILNTYVPVALSVIPAVPILAAPLMQ